MQKQQASIPVLSRARQSGHLSNDHLEFKRESSFHAWRGICTCWNNGMRVPERAAGQRRDYESTSISKEDLW